jgi:haloacetate dehalogenase
VFEGFTLEHVDVGEVTLPVRHGGDGQPVVLLHGHPRTHTTWHRIARRWPARSSSPAQICALTI